MRPPRVHRDLTRGSIPGNLWFLAWPQLTEAVLGVLDQIADLIWVGRLGFQAIAGMGLVQAFIVAAVTFKTGLEVAARAMIARAVGAGRTEYANHVLLQSMTVAGVLGAGMVVLGWTLSDPALRIFGLSDEVVREAVPYMRIQLLVIAVWGVHGLAGGALQASGDVMTPLKAETVSRVGHLVLSPILIFGWLGMPSLGLAGAAAASLAARSVGLALNLYGLSAGSSKIRLRFQDYRFDAPLLWRLFRIGLPASGTDVQRGLSRLAVMAVVAPFGATTVAAFTLARRAELASMLTGRAVGRAAGVLAGQNLGAGHPQRARASVWWGIAYVGLVSLPASVLMMAFPEQIASFVNEDAAFVEAAASWLTVIALGYFALAGAFVFINTLNTSGETIAPMVVSIALTWSVEVPLAFALSRFTSLDHTGVPWAIIAGAALRFAALAAYAARGKWLRVGVV